VRPFRYIYKLSLDYSISIPVKPSAFLLRLDSQDLGDKFDRSMVQKTITKPHVGRSLEGDPADLLIPSPEYCLKPIAKSFENFDEVILPLLDGTTDPYDVTVFYSRRRGITTEQHESLLRHNQHAFDAAKHVPGLVIYFQGYLEVEPDEDRLDPKLNLSFTPDCMSFCIWRSLSHAKAGAAIPEHKEAAARVDQWYGCFAIKKYKLHVQDPNSKTPSIVFEEYERIS
jgi:hypothetical protein